MGWLSGWLYRKSHVINPASGAGTNYQIKIIVHYGSGTDSGPDVYLNGKCRTDFGDVRFTASDGVTLLDYWMETYVASDYAVFWVEVADDLSSNPVTIYIYYGKSDATSISNGVATFIAFDDFEGSLSGWTLYASAGSATATIVNGRLRITKDATDGNVYFVKGPSLTNFAVAAKVYQYEATGSGDSEGVCGRCTSASAVYWGDHYNCTPPHQYRIVKPGVSLGHVSVTAWAQGEGHLIELCIYGSSLKLYVDNVLRVSVTDTSFTSGYAGIQFYEASRTAEYDDFRVRKWVDPEPAQDGWGSEESAGLTFSDTVSPTIEDTYSVSVAAPLSFGDTVSPTIEDTYSVSIALPLSFGDTVSPTIEDSYSVSVLYPEIFEDVVDTLIEDSYSIIVLYPEIFRDTVSPTIEDSYSIIILIPKTFRDTIDVAIEDSYSVKTVIMPPPPGASIVIYGLWRLVERMLGMP